MKQKNSLDKHAKVEAIPFGTKEWSDDTKNILKGCSHDCQYCYAKTMAVDRFKSSTVASWVQEELISLSLNKQFRPQNKTVMFPSAHDIVPKYLPESLLFIRKLVSSFEKVVTAHT